MDWQDLGELDGQILLFGGPYSNLEATRAMRAEAARRGIPAGHAICTGDVVAYCGDPAATVREIRDWGCHVVAGNCERQLAGGAGDCGCGFEEGSRCDGLSVAWFHHADRQIGRDDRAWMGTRPGMIAFTHAARRYAVVHGGLSDISRFLWPNSPSADFAEEIALIEAQAGPVDAVIAGHCGLAFARRAGRVEWLNAGAIGMPPNDGDPQTRYLLLDRGQPGIRRLSYDARAARDAMRRAGLIHGYDTALVRGYWPSEEVLPPDLRRAATASG